MLSSRQIMMLVLLACQILIACGGGGGSPNNGNNPPPTSSNQAHSEYLCDLNGADATLIMDVEAVEGNDVVYGTGPTPDITGVIGKGNSTYLTSGDLRSNAAYYIFTGENQYADFTDMNTSEQFRVQWMFDGDNLVILINPFGPGPTNHSCVLQDARYL